MAGFERQRLADRLAALLAPAGDPGDLDGALRCIVDAAATLFGPDLCAVLAINPVTRKPMPPLRHTGALYSGAPLIDAPPRADGITRRVLEAGVVFVEQIADHPEYQSAFVQVEQIHAFAAITLTGRVRNEPLAVLYLDYRAPRRFDEVFREHVQQFATAAAALLQQTWLLHRYAEVARIGKEINHELSTVEELFQQLYTYMSQILDVSHGLLLAVYQNERNTLDLHLFEEGAYLYRRDDPLDGYCEYVLREERTLLVRRLSVERSDLPAQPAVIGGTELREEALIFVPLLIRDRALGVLSIQSPRPAAYDDEDARLLELLGNHVALALGNIRLFERLTHVNDVGRLLTDRFDADHTLEQLTRRIAAGLRADLVTLYLYDGTTFARPIRSGHMLEPDYPDTIVTRNDHAAFLALEQPSAVFARESTHLYELLGGGSGKRTGFFERREQIRSTAAVPLKIGKDPLGVLFVNYRQPQRFDALQCRSIETMASYAAVALRSSQLFADQRDRQLRELQILHQIDRALAATLDLEPTLKIILELTLAHVAGSKGSIFLYDPDHNVLETCAFHSTTDPNYRQNLTITVDPPQGLVGWAFQERRPVRVNNIRHDPLWSDRYVELTAEVQSELDVPLTDGDEVIGVLNIESTDPNAFSQRDEAFFVTLAGQAVLAIKKAQAYEREKRLAEERAALVAISREIIAHIEPEAVFHHILQLALKITNAQAGTLMLYDPQRDYVHMAAGVGVHPDHQDMGHPVSQGVVGMVVRERRLINVGDVREPPWNAIHLSFIPGVCSELAVPLLEGEHLRGVLNVESLASNHFSDRDERLLTAFADQALIALQHARMYERFRILDETGRALAAIADPAQVERAYRIVRNSVLRVQPDCQVAIRRYEPAGDELRLVMCRPDHPIILPLVLRVAEGGLNARVAQTRTTVTIRDTNVPPPELSILRHPPTVRSMICAPLLLGSPERGEYFGNLTVLMEAPDQVLEVDRLLLEGLAQQLALTLHRLHLAEDRLRAEESAYENDKLALVGQFALEVLHRWGNETRPIRVAVNSIRRQIEASGVASAVIEQELRTILEDWEQSRRVLRMLNEDPQEARALLAKSQVPRKISVTNLLNNAIKLYPYNPASMEVIVEPPAREAYLFARKQEALNILRNVFMNAVQAQPNGGRIVLRALVEPTVVQIEIADDGPGIAEEHQQRIFEPNYTTKEGGTGFGLFSARRYARLNNGELTLRSTPGAGCTFVLTLPLYRPRLQRSREGEGDPA